MDRILQNLCSYNSPLLFPSPSGRRHSFPKYDHGIVYFRLEGRSEAGIWTYTARLHHSVHNGAPVTLEVFGEHSSASSSSSSLVGGGSGERKGIRYEIRPFYKKKLFTILGISPHALNA